MYAIRIGDVFISGKGRMIVTGKLAEKKRKTMNGAFTN